MDALIRDHLSHLDGDAIIHINHELRTPLAAIMGNVEILAELSGADDPQFERQLFAIARGVERLTSVVNGFLRS